MKMWECAVCGNRFGQEQSHVCRGKEIPFEEAVNVANEISTPAGRISAGRAARDRRTKKVTRTQEEELCGFLKEGRCVAGQELENARVVNKELRRELEAQASRVREADARAVPDKGACQAAREEAEKLRANIAGLELELEAKRVCHEKDNEFLVGERDEANKRRVECHRVWQGFINDCAVLLGLPKLSECGDYGGIVCSYTECRGAIRKGIEEMRKKLDVAELTADGVAEGSAEWEEDAKTAQAELKRFRGALEKINELRNDMIGRQSMGFSKHLYPLVAALNEAGFEGALYEKARERVEATIKAAREMAAGAWGQEATKDSVMDVHVAEEFAEILFPFLETLEFYALLGNWQDMKGGQKESACDRDLGSLARATLGHPDRNVPEIIEDADEEKKPIGTETEEDRCAECGQVDAGQTGEYPCSVCGAPKLWDDEFVDRLKEALEASGSVHQWEWYGKGVVSDGESHVTGGGPSGDGS